MHHTSWRFSNAATVPLVAGRIIAYDSEFVRERSYYPKLSLIQLHQPGWPGACLIDGLNENSEALWARLEKHDAPLVLHSAEQDLELMRANGATLTNTLRDTQIGFALCHRQKNVAYAEMIASYLGIALNKSATRSDWLKRPLSDRQCQYAADDVGPLTACYPLLCAELQRLGRLSWWAEECRRLLAAHRNEEKKPYHWYKLRAGPQKLRKAQLPAAEALCALREAVAAAQDLPRRKVLDDEKLIAIALGEPSSLQDLANVLTDDHPLLTDTALGENIFTQALKRPPPARPRAARVSEKNKKALETLLQFNERTAADLDIAADTLASGQQLREWLNSDCQSGLLTTGWRGEIFAAFKRP